MSPGVLIGIAVVMMAVGWIATRMYVKRAHGEVTEATMMASQGNLTVPSWVSLVVLAGWVGLAAGIVWAVVSWLLPG